MDTPALRIANVLVGNDEHAAGLEITLRGPTIEFRRDAVIAIAGADLAPEIADVTLPTWRAISVSEGAVLRFGEAEWGCRAYLAVLGGIDTPKVMNSRSTYTRAAIGGIEGGPLKAGDDLPIGSSATRRFDADTSFGPLPFALTERRLRPEDLKKLYDRDRPVRILRGPQFDLFDERDRNKFLNEAFEVSTSSDRMGYRLCGPVLDSGAREELTSSAVLAGTVQVPPSGEPIILMADRQTTGGYPVIGLVVTADLSLLAQLCPGNQVLFEEVTLEYAQTALRSQAKLVQSFKTEVVTYASSRP